MIFQFNADEGVGLIMLSDGQTKDFDTKDWVDETNEPSLGQEILYEMTDGVAGIPIEERDASEVTQIFGKNPAGFLDSVQITPDGISARNFAFDVTPARLVTGLITERGICPASEAGLSSLFPECT